MAPGLTVKSRLQVLMPGHEHNYYDLFELCPSEALRQKLNQAAILIENWHTLMPLKEPERSVVRKGREGDEAFVRRVLGPVAGYRDWVVINDEAHHAYRKPADIKVSKADAEALGIDLDEATRWIEGLDRIHKMRRIARCYDLSATPFAPTGRSNTEAGLFEWVVSDFGLNDAIEAGLVKTPRVVVRDDALPNPKSLQPKLYHLYREPEVAQDLNRKAEPHEPLPELVQQAYTLLGADWRAIAADWAAQGHRSPPVMLTVCNRTETAARVEHYFSKGHAQWAELHAPARTLRVDSKVLEKAEVGETATANKAYEARLRDIVQSAAIDQHQQERWLAPGVKKEEVLRELVDTVGKPEQIGQDLQNVISVAMLSEGWDAKTVTHIMGLRAFTSQLLCEQVIGRGLRRVAYDVDPETGLYAPEYVNVFGVPLSVAIQPGEGGSQPPPPKPSVQIKSLPERQPFEIKWPNILRIDRVVRPELTVEWSRVPTLTIDPAQVALTADIAPALGGAAEWSQIVTIDLEKLPEEFRLQRLVFKAAQKAFEKLQEQFKGQREYLLFQLVRLVETFLASNRIDIPSLFHQDPLRRRILLSLHMDAIVEHLMSHVIQQNTLRLEPVFDGERPVGSTRDMRPWYTTRVVEQTQRCQISHIVVDSGWEKYAANVAEKHPDVAAWVKNDHLGFHVLYLYRGSKRKYVPDFLVRYKSGKMLVLEIKGEDSPLDQAKRRALDEWVQAVNAHGGFGIWASDVVVGTAAGLQDVLARHAPTSKHEVVEYA